MTNETKQQQNDSAMKELTLLSEGEDMGLMPQPKSFDEVLQFCHWIASSRIVPEAYRNNPADIFVAAQYGREIGLGFMTSVQKIAVIGGRPALPSDIKLAIVRKKKLLEWHKEATIDEIKQTGKAWCEMKRVDVPNVMRHQWTIDDAKRAGLWERMAQSGAPTPWKSYSYRMLQLKPRDWCLKDLYPDLFFGIASVEEAQEVQMIEHEQQPEVLLEAQSQPQTAGAKIISAEAPPLEERPQSPDPEPGDPEPIPAEPPPTDPEPEEPAPATALAQIVDGTVEQLRALPQGGMKVMKLWQQFKLPTGQFGKKRVSELITNETTLALFGNEVQKMLIELEKKKG